MIYPSIRIEGAILDRLDDDDALGQRPADFGLDTGTKVKDEIARAWADAQDYWRIFQRKLETLRPDSPATTETRQQWITPLLGLLGYQLEYQPKGVELNGKTYAISHRGNTRDAYGWTDLNLGHDFVKIETLPENARVRYTINPAARKEVLKRPLAENHRRAAAKALAADAAMPAKKKRGKKLASDDTNGELFS